MAEPQALFVGTYDHGLDEKGRMVLPSKIRALLGERGMVGMADGCLGLWTIDGFGAIARLLATKVASGEATRAVQRKFMAHAAEVIPDQQGRVVIPPKLRDHAGLGKEVVVNGLLDRAEIWSKEAWSELLHSDSSVETEEDDVGEAFAALRL